MSVGTYFSGTAHVGLIVWMVVGWGTQSDPLPFEITEVSVVSGDDFAAMTQGVQPDHLSRLKHQHAKHRLSPLI